MVSFNYLTSTRPKITYVVGVMSRYIYYPKKCYYPMKSFGGSSSNQCWYMQRLQLILYKKGEEWKSIGYCDSYYGGYHDTNCYTIGFVVKIGAGVIYWCS